MRPTHLPNPHNFRALIAYGDQQTAETLRELLAACGQEVLVASEEETACDLSRRHRPDVVLLDLRMHDEDVAQRLRKQTELQDIALVAITSPEREEAALRSTEHGFVHYLVEPVDPVQVQALLKKLHTPR
jgi:CheY-like chemotaxis protein